ncbi:CRISPR-associated protein Cas4 [Vulcanisaeta thermophila]|uniref:CRISPR-associated protein Cas4 n=1 Tax=Vulcanisaeta thermophila TaxID=867917 RepID=UPI0008539F58|nr:CRISPR-associated protein Cas4 [Vulcanisaeta thermophila]
MLGRVFNRVRLFSVGDLPIEVRGWSREVSDVSLEYMPSVSEVFSPCPTHRDVYLRRVLNVAVKPNDSLNLGRALHDVFLAPFRLINRVGVGGLIDELFRLKQDVISQVPGDLRGFASIVFEHSARFLMDITLDDYPIPISVEPGLGGVYLW